jgi:CRP-like cAMP-binding protein
MQRQPWFRHDPEARSAFGAGKRDAVVEPSPRQNHLLAALPSEVYKRLLPDLKPVSLPLGWNVYSAGERERYLYFLTAGIVARVCMTASGASAESAITGNEGVIGVASVLGGESRPDWAVVVCAGHAFRLDANALKHEFEHDGPLPRLLLRYTYSLIEQTGQIAACNRHHLLEQRLSRWILSCLDRTDSSELTMTHDLIASMLGVRREGVTEAVRKLQGAGLVRCGRSRIAVLDRHRLEAHACECYAHLKLTHHRRRQAQ